jgi:transcription termination factor Rho
MAETVSGIFKLIRNGLGVLRDPRHSFRRQSDEVMVGSALIREHGLVPGATVVGTTRQGKKGRFLAEVELINQLDPASFRRRTPYTRLTAVDPFERFCLAECGLTSMRVIDLVAPIGKGTRGLIVAPPKAGKTTILENMAAAIRHAHPRARIMALLVDERPEEVTHFRRAVEAEVLHSSSDQSVQDHIELVEIAMACIRTELECGSDVVVLIDSLTRMGRAFNQRGSRTGRTMSGGLEAGALEIPRRFFGLARAVEDGGSVTILATALIDTGSRMDELIFEEFKGTGNSEIILERSLAERGVFPAVNISASGTRKEERLFNKDEYKIMKYLRRCFADMRPKEAMEKLLALIERYPANQDMIAECAEGLPQKKR